MFQVKLSLYKLHFFSFVIIISVVNDINTSASDLNEDFEKKGNWAFQWNMNFNPDPKRSFFKNTRLETLKSRRWFRKLYLFYNILHSKSPSYLFNLIPENSNPYASRSALNNQIPFVNAKTNFLKNSFFPAVVTEFAKLRASRAYVPYVRTCLTCLCALRAYVPSCLKLLRTFVPTCLRTLNYYVPTCLSYLRALREYVLYVPTCLFALIP